MSFFLIRLYPQLFVRRAHVFFPGSTLSPVVCKEGSCLFFLVRLYPQLFVRRVHVFFPDSSLSPVICKEGSCLFSWFDFIPSFL